MKAFEITEAGKEALPQQTLPDGPRELRQPRHGARPLMLQFADGTLCIRGSQFKWFLCAIAGFIVIPVAVKLRRCLSIASSVICATTCVMTLTRSGLRTCQVGHTGDLKAVVRACTTVDRHLGDLLETVEKMGGRWLVSSDHGNADDMVQVPKATCMSTARVRSSDPDVSLQHAARVDSLPRKAPVASVK